MATEAEVKAALQQLMDYYSPKDMTPKRLAIYRQQLARLDGDVLQRATARCLATLTWMPKLNEIFAIADQLPAQAAVGNQLRAQAFALEHLYWHENTFIADDWRKLGDSMARAHMAHSSQRITERAEAIKCFT